MEFWKRLRRALFSLQEGSAHRVIFYYQGEEPTYLEDAYAIVYRNGVVEVKHRNEHVTTHVQNVEISWKNLPGKFTGTGRPLSLVKNEAESSPTLN